MFSRNSLDRSSARSSAAADRVGLVAGWKRLIGDSLSLAGLQARLISTDGKVWFGVVRTALLLLIASIVIGLVSVSFLLAAAVVGLIVLGLHIGWALLVVAIVGFALAVITGMSAVKTISRSLSSFDRSREEFKRNMDWMREQVLKPNTD